METVKFYVNSCLTILALIFGGMILFIVSQGEIGIAIFGFIISILPILSILYAINHYHPKISHKKDEFNGVIWIYISKYKGCRFRALLKNNMIHAIQLYVETNNSDWVYFNSARGEDQFEFELIKIDSDVKIHGFGEYKNVRTHEVFALDIPLEYLEKMSNKDWKIKAYGKRGDKIFTIPQKMSRPFFDHISAHLV